MPTAKYQRKRRRPFFWRGGVFLPDYYAITDDDIADDIAIDEELCRAQIRATGVIEVGNGPSVLPLYELFGWPGSAAYPTDERETIEIIAPPKAEEPKPAAPYYARPDDLAPDVLAEFIHRQGIIHARAAARMTDNHLKLGIAYVLILLQNPRQLKVKQFIRAKMMLRTYRSVVAERGIRPLEGERL